MIDKMAGFGNGNNVRPTQEYTPYTKGSYAASDWQLAIEKRNGDNDFEK